MTPQPQRYVKFLRADFTGPFSNKKLRINRWQSIRADKPLVMCQRGYHVAKIACALGWINELCLDAEIEGVCLFEETKVCAQRVRLTPNPYWTPRTARLLACDFAEEVLYLTTDPRPAQAIEVARAYANGLATDRDVSAAREAAVAAWAAGAAGAAAGAAGAAAWAAAGAAAGVAAGAAATQRHNDRLAQLLRGELYR